MYMTNYDPFFGDALRKFFLNPVSAEAGEGNYLTPAVDIKEDESKWTFLINVPGVKPADINVHVEDGDLLVEAHREEEHKEEKGKYTHVERCEGGYKRRFSLPTSADANGISAKADNGVLSITVRKKEEVQPKKIAVDVANG